MTTMVRWGWFGLLWAMIGLVPGQSLAQEDGDEAEGLSGVQAQTGQKSARLDVVQSRFFSKAKRLEVFPHVYGVVLNNSFAWRHQTLTGLNVAYHLNESLQVEGVLAFYPDLSGMGYIDLKSLPYSIADLPRTSDLLPILVPKERLFVGGSINISPIYGKLNLVGSYVQSFDVSFLVGGGLLRMYKVQYATNYVYNEQTQQESLELDDVGETGGSTYKLFPVGDLGIAARFFVTPWMTFRADVRMHGYIDQVELAQEGTSGSIDAGNLSYQNVFRQSFALTTGLSVFLPR